MIVYQIKINLLGFELERDILEYTVVEQQDASYTMNRKGSLGVYTVQKSALDKQLPLGGTGYYFYTTDKSKLNDYGKILDEFMSKYIADKLKKLTKYQTIIGSSWGDIKSKETKTKKHDNLPEDDDI